MCICLVKKGVYIYSSLIYIYILLFSFDEFFVRFLQFVFGLFACNICKSSENWNSISPESGITEAIECCCSI